MDLETDHDAEREHRDERDDPGRGSWWIDRGRRRPELDLGYDPDGRGRRVITTGRPLVLAHAPECIRAGGTHGYLHKRQ
jgi:hypothetical protein